MSADYTDQKIRHLEMLQVVITRMAMASDTIKRLCLAVVAATLAFAATKGHGNILPLAGFLVLVFWSLDARYLQQEKWYRNMYDEARKISANQHPDFKMTPGAEAINGTAFRCCLIRWSTAGVYVPLLVFLLIVREIVA